MRNGVQSREEYLCQEVQHRSPDSFRITYRLTLASGQYSRTWNPTAHRDGDHGLDPGHVCRQCFKEVLIRFF